MKLVMFDIDGTLTETVGVDEVCFVQALRELFGFTDINTDWSVYPHCTDSGIVEALFQQRMGRLPSPPEIGSLQTHFVSLLAGAKADRPFAPLTGARAFLERLAAEPGIAVSLATGGWECSARLKLASAGLDSFQLPGAFSDDANAREQIMQKSYERAARHHARQSFDKVTYIGDGVWDVRAARNAGYSFIGMAAEPKRAARLRGEGAGTVFSDYADQEALMKILTGK